MNPRKFFGELKRRNVYKVAVAYAVVAWLLIQIVTQTFPFFEVPNWAIRLVILLLIIGFPVALILAWAFELTPQGIKRTESVEPAQSSEMQAQPAEPVRNNLPAQLSSFIGREEQITEIKHLLGSTRLLTLTGAGGSGKTRLALRVAADLLSQYPNGVWLVALAPASDPDMVIQLAARALHVPEDPQRPLLATVVSYLESRHLLVVLDNCEHLLDACAAVVLALLEGCSKLQILATSREAIGVAGESVWHVPPLATPKPASVSSLPSLSQFEAVRLFVDRAVAVQPRFALTAGTASAVAQICWRLGGIPLAIELAAARMSALSAEQIAELLCDSFQLLSHGKRTALPRHQTLQAAMDWSYALLTEQEQILFQRLGVFSGGFALEAVENVCAGDGLEPGRTLDLLTSLVEKSLALVHEHRRRMRYGILEPIRQYSRERLVQSGTETKIEGRHVHYFVRLAERIEPLLLGSEQQQGLDELEIEHADFMAALRYAVEHEPETALKLCNALGWFWEKRGSLAEGRDWFMRTIARSPLTAVNMRGEAYVRAGRIACWQGEYEEAVTLTEQGLRLCKESRNHRWTGMALNNLGGIAAYRGEPEQAQSWLEQSLAIGKEYGDDDLVWRSLGDFSVVAMLQGDYESARDLIEQALLITRRRGDEEAKMLCLRGQGEIECAFGNDEKAASCYEETLAIARKLGHKRAFAGALEGLGKVAFNQGDHARARAFYEEGLQTVKEMGEKSLFAITLEIDLAELAAEDGRFDEARRLCTTALRNSQEVGDKESIAAALRILASLASRSYRHAEAAAQLLGALETMRESLRMPVSPRDRVRDQRCIAAIRGALAEDLFMAAWARGKAMSIEQAIACTLQDTRE